MPHTLYPIPKTDFSNAYGSDIASAWNNGWISTKTAHYLLRLRGWAEINLQAMFGEHYVRQ